MWESAGIYLCVLRSRVWVKRCLTSSLGFYISLRARSLCAPVFLCSLTGQFDYYCLANERLNIWHIAKNQYGKFAKNIPEKELHGYNPNLHIHVSVSDLYISTIDLPIPLQEICGPILGIYKSLTDK